MSANILVVEYEPRYLERIRKALAGAGYRLEEAADLDAAVESCAHFEPQLVVITSVLPRLKIEDAITQLRARAGLRDTPILVLMSGYRGSDPRQDAVRYGAQDILERPFSGELLLQRVERLLETSASPATTQAIPQDMLDALRRSAGLSGDSEASMTSDELFGDILSDVEEDTGVGQAPTAAPPAGEPKEAPASSVPHPPKPGSAAASDKGVDDALANMLEGSRTAPPIRRAAKPSDTDVDMILSQTLAGLDIQPVRGRSKRSTPETSEAPAAPAAKTAPQAPPAAPPEKPPATHEAPPPVAAPADAQAPPAKSTAPPAAKSAPPPPPEPEASPKVPPKAAAGTQFGQYVLQDHIATGGMAEVYKARMMGMEGFQKTVAIKRILPHLTDNDEFVSMFIDEAKLAAQLNHNNIIHIYDLGKIDRSYYIAMEYIKGRDLRSILQECRERQIVIPVALSLYMATLLASALDYAHKKRDFENRDLGLVHRDVSPQNVLISDDGLIKLCDFGIAKAASKASHTRAGALKGKLQYMSPEQAWGKDIDHRSDIFSLGVVLYEMLTGDKAFAGDSELSILEQVRNPQVELPSKKNPEISAAVERVAMKALEAERDKRYQSALDLQRDLEKAMREAGWAPDAAVLAGFLHQLENGQTITQYPAKGAAAEAKAAATAPAKEAAPLPVVASAPAATEDAGGDKQSRKAKTKSRTEPTPTAGAAAPGPGVDKAEAKSSPPEPAVELADDSFAGYGEEKKKPSAMLWLGVAAAVIVVLGLLWTFGRDGGETPPVAAPTPDAAALALAEPTPTSTPTEEEMELARRVAEAEVERQETELRRRLEKEFPTPTPAPPTPSPTATPTITPTPEPQATATPRPSATPTPVPTATPIPPTATPSVREGDIVTPGAGVVAPVIIHQVEPKYPPVALRMRTGGVVEIEALVGIDGRVENVRVLSVSRSGLGFESSTEEAVRQWRYRPATKDGVKVRMWVKLRVPFRAR